jgi:hypothetical protein
LAEVKVSLVHILLVVSWLLTGCEKWYTTEDVSHISYIPKFQMAGGEFISVQKQDSAEFEDPGVTASSNGEPLTVYASGSVDLSKVGVYLIKYYAQNVDGIVGKAERIIAVTNFDVSNNDLSGSYTGTVWEPVESKVKKIDQKGLYECEDVMGFPGFEMPGRFVDLGGNELVLLHGEGFFGRYGNSEGEYTRSTLSWTVFLLDPPYEGIEIPVLWRKKN